ncbi:DHA2 family efflux MFS transporter permease subunit [Actinomadura rudentiformis]|uniref:DHA2 family efflux MFS transporter permease subunit n=1 Tax=Actinomadura rudentiformis TaxID=359158 RepID=A0A6H9YRS3_9ACTN|nr:DHA2 family efflux MFS transporter permease subunit [Actinomadura rudentiformis]KAB2350666.1 DHA2 family efflux MFS transporter permease subunit [Actinomadura rudentiformis]
MRHHAARTFIVTGIALFMVSLDNLIVTNALPSIRTDLGTGLEALEWTVNAYTLTFAVLLLTGAAVADRFGRRRLFAIGLTVFTASSAAAALAPGIGTLIAARAVQGAGAAIITPLTLTMLAAAVPAAKRGQALAAWGAMSGLGVALGPVVGGALTDHAGWQWIFWINVPIGVALLALVRPFLSESHGPRRPLDLVGTLLVSAGLLGIVLGLVEGNGRGWTSGLVLTSLTAGAVLLAGFLVYEARAAHPMLPLALFRGRGFSAVNGTALVMSFGMFGSVFLLAQFLQGVQGMSPLEAGVRTLPWTAMPVLVAPLTAPLMARIGARNVLVIALAFQTAGIVWMSAVTTTDVSYSALLPAFVLAGIGMGLFFSPQARLVLAFAPQELTGVASGVSNALRQLGTVLGIAVLGAVFAANGDFESPATFTAGLTAATWSGAAVLAVAVVVALIIPARMPASAATATTPEPAEAAELPEVAKPAQSAQSAQPDGPAQSQASAPA